MSEFSIRRAQEGDHEQVVALLEKMFMADVSERVAWLYKGNPHGQAVTWVAVAEDDGALVGVTSVFPRKLWIDGQKVLGSIGGDCYIEPRARRRGLATRLHQATLEGMAEAGISFMYGPPLAKNLGALLKAGSQAVGSLRRHIRPLTKEGVIDVVSRRVPALAPGARYMGPPIRLFDGLLGASARGVSLRLVSDFGPEFERLFAVQPPARVCPVRDPDFLRWRYLLPNLPSVYPFAVERRGEVVGLAVLEIKDNVAVVVDLYAMTERFQGAALVLLARVARDRGCDYIDVYRTGGGPSLRLLRLQGYVGREERVFQVLAPEGTPKVVFDPAAWHFTEGDKDSPTTFSSEPV